MKGWIGRSIWTRIDRICRNADRKEEGDTAHFCSHPENPANPCPNLSLSNPSMLQIQSAFEEVRPHGEGDETRAKEDEQGQAKLVDFTVGDTQ